MDNTPSYAQVAESFALWCEYADPQDTMTEEEWDAIPVEDRITILEECFGKE